MVQLAVLSDTHVPSRASEIPEWVRDRIATVDHTVHAGDFDSSKAFDRVREAADGDLTAVAGNMDPQTLDLDRVETLTVENVRFVVTHGTGTPENYEDRIVNVARESDGDVGIGGHTHETLVTTYRGVRLLNPGSATGVPPATAETMMTVTVDDGTVDVELHER
jgi:hypothetical protein